MEKVREGCFEAYCPKVDDSRAIHARLIELFGTGEGRIGYDWPIFNCDDIFTCEYYDRFKGCPFLREIFNDLS